MAQRVRPSGQPRHPQRDGAAQRVEPLRPQPGVPALGQRVADLPLGAAVQQRHRAAVAEVDPRGGIGLPPGQPEPEQVDRRRGAHRLQPGQAPQAGEAPVGPHHQQRPHLVPPVPGPVAHPADVPVGPVPVLHQGLDAGARDQPEGGAAPGLADDEVEEAHLGHESHERERRLEAADVVLRHRPRRRAHREDRHPGQGDREHAVGQPHLPEQVQRRRLQGVAPEIAVEVAVGLEQRDGDALPGQQQGQHGAGRPPPTTQQSARSTAGTVGGRSGGAMGRCLLLRVFRGDGGRLNGRAAIGSPRRAGGAPETRRLGLWRSPRRTAAGAGRAPGAGSRGTSGR